MATGEFSKFADILSGTLSTASKPQFVIISLNENILIENISLKLEHEKIA